MLYIPWFKFSPSDNRMRKSHRNTKYTLQNIISISQIYSICILHEVYYVQLMKRLDNIKNLLLKVDFTPLT